MAKDAANMIEHDFLAQSRRLLTHSYLPRIEKSVDGLSDEQLWWRANAGSNSIGNLILHLAGNVRQWIVSGIGGDADDRDRQREFDERGPLPAAELLARLRSAVEDADRVLANVAPEALLERRRIQTYDVTTMQAIHTVVEHFSMHTGQVIVLAKMWKGDLGLYTLSHGVPHPAWSGARDGD
jgi:uncharacterized damage-inducible protein DinB